VAIPDVDVSGAAIEEAGNGTIDLCREELTHFAVFRVGLFLTANTRNAFCVSDHKHRLWLRGRRHGDNKRQNCGFHRGPF